MKILVVGAGAVGQVYAWHLAQAGHEVSFFVKARYAEALSSGATLYRLSRWRTRQQDFRGFGLVTEPTEVAAQRWDQVWLALPSDAMRGELATRILASVGRATVVCLQPDIEDIDYVRAQVPAGQVVQGLITFISFQSPLPGCAGPEGMAYYLPPLAPGLFGGEPQRTGAVVAALKAGGMAAKEVPDFALAAAGAPAMMQPLMVALEVSHWRLSGFTGSRNFGVGLAASREALAVAEKHAGADIGPLKPLLRPLVWKLLLPLIRQLLPFDLESLLRYHYGKVRTQTLMMLDSYIRLGEHHGLQTPALVVLRGQLAALTNQDTDHSGAVCIVGAGPAGLSVARALKRLGIPYEQFERHSDVGGIWDLSNPGSPMYHSAHFISSRNTSGFYDFPMPDDYPDYPSNRQILAYTRSFARAFGLYDAIRFQTAIEHVEKDGESWLVRLSGGEVRRYRAVVCSTGTNWHPRLPRHEGPFNGEIRHSVTFKHADEFRNKRVLVIGLGNSGADIACDAAANADAAFVSVRRGYHFIPKHVFGIPVDEFANNGPQLPMWLQRPFMTLLLRMVLGDTSRTGMPKPDHKLFESHPLLNSQLLHYLQHGDIKAKGDVKCFDGDDVVFADGSREQIDLVLYATGYNMAIPYVPEAYFEWDGGRPKLNLTAFNPRHNNLFGVGYLETNSSAYTLFDRVAQMVVNYLHDQEHHPDNARAFERQLREDRPDLSGGIKFVESDRTKGYIEIHAYKKYIENLRARMGWPELVPGFFDTVRSQVGMPVEISA